MTESVLAVETFDSIAIARQLMAKHRVNQLPVMDNDNLVGIVTDRDIRDAYPTSLMIDRTEEIDRFADKVTVEDRDDPRRFHRAAGDSADDRCGPFAASSDRLAAGHQRQKLGGHHYAQRHSRFCPAAEISGRGRKRSKRPAKPRRASKQKKSANRSN